MKPLLLLIAVIAFLFFNIWLSIPAVLNGCVNYGPVSHPLLSVKVQCAVATGDKP